ncbi:MAG: hypothetical protein OXG05_10710 [Gammaproteobacteria bacterium]|nr:hypothetical protein [Gammaproteobacteria bacterium]
MTQSLPYSKELLQCVEAGSEDLLLGAKAVSRVLNPDSDLADVDSRLLYLAEEIQKRGESVEAMLKVFHDEGFKRVDEDNFHEYVNSDIAHVLASKEGIPITYVAIILGVTAHLSLTSHGVNFPGVFLAQVDDTIVNPIDFSILNYEEFTSNLKKRNIDVPDRPELASNSDILKRMFNNLQEVASAKGDVVRRLEFVDYMELIEPDDWFPHFKRAEAWASMGDYGAARSELKIARGFLSDESTIAMIDRNLAQLPERSDGDQILN